MVKKGMKKFLAGMCAVLVYADRNRTKCSCQTTGTGIASVRRKSDESRVETMVQFAREH